MRIRATALAMFLAGAVTGGALCGGVMASAKKTAVQPQLPIQTKCTDYDDCATTIGPNSVKTFPTTVGDNSGGSVTANNYRVSRGGVSGFDDHYTIVTLKNKPVGNKAPTHAQSIYIFTGEGDHFMVTCVIKNMQDGHCLRHP